MNQSTLSEEEYKSIYGIADSIRAEVDKVVTGKQRETVLLICALIAGGHVLIEDVPGVGKTTLASALAQAAGLSFKRAQFTPDVMASDITGFNIYNRKTESFEFREGLVSTNILLADEINRASPKTQSSLLEAMEETQVTVDGTTYDIPSPFMVIATQTPPALSAPTLSRKHSSTVLPFGSGWVIRHRMRSLPFSKSAVQAIP